MPPAYHNQFPATDPGPLRLALIGESLGTMEVSRGLPFQGAAGQQLDIQLAKVGLLRSKVFVGNVAAVQPFKNDFNALDWTAPEVQDGIAALLADLTTFRPNLVFPMGNPALYLFATGNVAPPRRRQGKGFVYDWPRKITDWRGSLFESSDRTTPALQYGVDATLAAPLPDTLRWKCLASVHPAFCLRSWSEWFNFQRDLRLAHAEASTPVLNLPVMDFDYGPR